MELASADRLIQPECLSVETLRQLLLQRSVQPKDLPSDRGGLVNLYNRLILPLPQRQHSSTTRLGRKFLLHQSTANKVLENSAPVHKDHHHHGRGVEVEKGMRRMSPDKNSTSRNDGDDFTRNKSQLKRQLPPISPPGEEAPETKKRRVPISWP